MARLGVIAMTNYLGGVPVPGIPAPSGMASIESRLPTNNLPPGGSKASENTLGDNPRSDILSVMTSLTTLPVRASQTPTENEAFAESRDGVSLNTKAAK